MPPVIELENLIKDYRGHRALDGVSLQIGPGVTGLLGPNGAGKSTLIKVILGLVRITSGRGSVLGYDIRTGGRRIRASVGYMPEDDAYIPGMNGVEMVRFTASMNGLPLTEGLRRSHEILDFCGMGQERYRDVDTYSTGMRQKLKFAQALVHDPQLLILDEPTSGLDPEERVAMLNRVQTLSRRSGKVTLLSTHILPDVRQVCDSVVILARGQVRLCESMETVNRPSHPGLFVRVEGSIERLANELQSLPGPGASSQRIDDHELFVEGDASQIEKQIWDSARRAGASIVALYPNRNSLDEVFMNAVRESHDAHS